MAADRIAEFLISIGGDGDLKSFMSGVKSQFKSDVAELESISNKVDLFSQLSDNLPKVQRAIDSAKDKIATLTAEIDKFQKAGEKAPDALTKGLSDAEKALRSATSEMQRQSQQAATLQSALARAGVDTKNLAAEQTRLAEAQKAAAEAAALAAAKQALGLTTIKDIQPELAKLNTAYTTLQKSGTLSATEIAAAQQILNQKTTELTAGVSAATTAAQRYGTEAASAFGSPIPKILAAGAVIATVTEFFMSAAKAAEEYENQLARVGTVTDVTKSGLASLGEGVREVARDLGIGLSEALRGLYDLLQSGVPKDNAVDVLRKSAELAIATNTDLSSSVKAANVLISAYGVQIEDLGGAFDLLTQAQRDGGLTVKEFADNTGALLNVARAAGVSLLDLTATLQVLKNNGLDAGAATSALTRIITQLGDPAIIAKLHGLGIEVDGLAGTFKQISERGLDDTNQLLELGLASTRSAAAIATLTNNAKGLPAELDKLRESAGATAIALNDLADTPGERKKRFDSATENLKVNLGTATTSSGLLYQAATPVVNLLANDLPKSLEEAALRAIPGANAFQLVREAIKGVTPAAEAATTALKDNTAASDAAGEAAKRSAVLIETQRKSLGAYATDLAKLIETQQSNLGRDIADINARADAEIAALDRSAKAQKETAAATLAIRTQQSNDLLALIQRTEANITAEVEKQIEARTAAAKKDALSQQQLVNDVNKIKLDAVSKEKTIYDDLYKGLIAQEQAFLAASEKSGKDRVAFNEDVENRILNIRQQGLSTFDQYLATVTRIDQLISKEREAAANNDIELAKKYANEAINLSSGIKAVTTENGVKIVTELQAQTTAIDKMGAAAKIVDGLLASQGDSAKKGADATKEQLAIVQDKLKELQDKYDELKRRFEAAIQLSISKDIKGIDDAESKIDELARDREVTLKVRLDIDDKGNVLRSVTVPESLIQKARGGFVGNYAVGGPVFRKPTWDKVPGIGNYDSIPARLNAGSFVVKKSASQYYGDGIMSMLARGYASGGAVGYADGGLTKPAPFGFPSLNLSTASSVAEFQNLLRGIIETFSTGLTASQPGLPILQLIEQLRALFGRITGFAAGGPVGFDAGGAVNYHGPTSQKFQFPEIKFPKGYYPDFGSDDANALYRKSSDMFDFLFEALAENVRKPAPYGELDYVNYLRNVRDLIYGDLYKGDLPGAGLLFDTISKIRSSIVVAAEQAGIFHTPMVFGTNAKFDDDFLQTTDQLRAALAAKNPPVNLSDLGIDPRGFLSGRRRGFADGGSVGDTVPAMLTPGEWVIPKHIASMLGGGFLTQLNNAQIPRAGLANLSMAPPPMPRGFAMGGPVDYVPRTGTATVAANAPLIGELHLHGAPADFLSVDNVRRFVAPALNEIERRAGKRK